MAHLWDPDKTIDESLALKLIKNQFPHLMAKTIRLLGNGWDNTAFLINDEIIFRFPRRQIAVPLIATELCILPKIAPFLPLPIPDPKWAGKPTDDFPWPFAGYRMLPGVTACRADLSNEERVKLAKPLAEFLLALHAIPLSISDECKLPGDIINRMKVSRLLPLIKKGLNELISLKLLENQTDFDKITEINYESRDPPKKAIVHGDFYVRHLLVDKKNLAIGVIDWGDIHIGDTAVDLSIAHSLLPQEGHAIFRSAYGEISEETWRLARLRAFFHSMTLAIYGHHSKDAVIHREGIRSLKQIASIISE